MKSCISTVGVNGNSPIREVQHSGWYNTGPDYFPDGRSIVFVSDMKKRYRYDLYRMGIDEGQPITLTTSRYGVSDPVVAPDGQSVFYLGGDETDLWQVNADGTHAHQVADSKLFSDPMNWKPESK